MNLITMYNNDPKLIKGHFDIYLLARKGLNSHYQFETNPLNETIDLIHLHQKKAFGWINRFIFENEMPDALELVNELIEAGVDGFMVNDFGWLLILLELGFKGSILLSTDTTITNHLEIEYLQQEGYSKIVIARELTFDEIVELAERVSTSMIVPIFGHQIMSTSRRQLFKAYGDLINKEIDSNKVYRLREDTRKDYFLGFQDETGTHLFDAKLFIGFIGLKRLLDLKVDTFLVDSFNLSSDQLNDSALLMRQIAEDQISGEQATLNYLEKYPDIEMTTALWYLKTAEKRDDL